MDKHEISGGAKQAEGKIDQVEGKTEKNVGKVKDAIKDQVS
jgi:uncharacterized protein YjbJ (UPF0337 family)